MDTRFWGPSAWKLFHLAAEICNGSSCTKEDRQYIPAFFDTIPYILPCKFCRHSLTDYYRDHPYKDEKGLLPREFPLQKWMYTIHNCVNEKLRKQGLYPSPNPPYRKVKTMYKQFASCPWKQQLSYVWDFLFSVAYHHPKEKQLYSKPIPECPKEVQHCKDSIEKNKWNVLPLNERMEWFTKFWTLLPAIFSKELSREWKKANLTLTGSSLTTSSSSYLSTRSSILEWLWKMRCHLERDYHDPYSTVCKKIASFSSDCATQKGAFTCRKKRHLGKKETHRAKKTKKHTRS